MALVFIFLFFNITTTWLSALVWLFRRNYRSISRGKGWEVEKLPNKPGRFQVLRFQTIFGNENTTHKIVGEGSAKADRKNGTYIISVFGPQHYT